MGVWAGVRGRGSEFVLFCLSVIYFCCIVQPPKHLLWLH